MQLLDKTNSVSKPPYLSPGTGDRVTATEMIDGVRHVLVLERDENGCYREVDLAPVRAKQVDEFPVLS